MWKASPASPNPRAWKEIGVYEYVYKYGSSHHPPFGEAGLASHMMPCMIR